MRAAITKDVQQGTLTFNDSLTLSIFTAILCLPCNIYEVGICSPRKGEKSPLPLAVFLCLLKMDAGLIRVKFIMVDCLRETLKSLARSFAGTANLIQSTAQCFAATGGGLFTSQRNTAMSQNKSAISAQAPIALNHSTVTALRYWLERAKQHAHDLVEDFGSHENYLNTVEVGIEISIALGLLNNPLAEEQATVTITPPAKTSPKEQTTTPKTPYQVFGIFCGPQLFDSPCQPLIPTFDFIQLERFAYCEAPEHHEAGCNCGFWYFQSTELSRFIGRLIYQLRMNGSKAPHAKITTPPQRQTTSYRYSKDPRGYDIRILCDVVGSDVQVNPNNAPPKGNEQVCLCCGNRDFKAATLFSYSVCPQCNTDAIYRCRYVAIAGGE
jgi:hypothetical protein